ncbi:ABC transporter ATP-binding protein [Paenibacillus donghaensis]|uniref:ABC transporter ATP-binding protein n=1 Tax=Paenibacillus donghaensis TaxID=414771 RepID=A0A2Z2K4C0_9BACL|nr:ABC transporter ATP-binding protein [Paenibacillus donghaensis]ASA20606.1 ABC transporter ATP-binding protein [Paenibacillus donghaensis]
MNTVLRVEGLTKSYGDITVLKGVSFTVGRGEIFGLLGANGAGKSTLLECIEQLRSIDSGTIAVEGRIGVQLQSASLPPNIRAYEVVTLFRKWSKNKAGTGEAEAGEFGLEDLGRKPYKDMSTGQKRRLHLALAVIGSPDILILDEPTSGLDVAGRLSLHSVIRRLKQQGTTILMASHDMAEVESLCDRLIILRDGRIAFSGTAQELTRNAAGLSRIYLQTERSLAGQAFEQCRYEGERQGYSLYSAGNLRDALLELLTTAEQQELAVLDVRIAHATLEQRFMELASAGEGEH